MLTKKQKEVLDFIVVYSTKKKYAPSLEEICTHFKLASVSTAYFYVEKLRESGYIEKMKHRARAISVHKKGALVRVPLLGTIAAGEPIEAIHVPEYVAVPKTLLPQKKELYALRVQGDSMCEENIHSGDIVLIQKQDTAENGDRVVALIDNTEATLKTFFKEKKHIRLQPANSAYKPIIIEPERVFAIQGVVCGVVGGEEFFHKENTTSVVPREKNMPKNKIFLKDVIIGLKTLPDESCDVVIIDPPYNIGKDFGNNIDKRELHEYVAWCKEWIMESVRVLKPAGTLFIYGFSEILAHISVEIPLQKRWLIWHYTNKNVASLNFWQRSHESIICAWKENPIFNRDAVREPYTEGFLQGAAGRVRKGTVGRYSKGGKETVYQAHEKGALPRDVLKIPALAGGAGMSERWFLCKTCNTVCEPRSLKKHEGHDVLKHPTQKPFDITRKLITSAMPQGGGVVLVPFVGSGSECAVAKELGNSYIGFEINPDFVRIAEKIVAQVSVQPHLL